MFKPSNIEFFLKQTRTTAEILPVAEMGDVLKMMISTIVIVTLDSRDRTVLGVSININYIIIVLTIKYTNKCQYHQQSVIKIRELTIDLLFH